MKKFVYQFLLVNTFLCFSSFATYSQENSAGNHYDYDYENYKIRHPEYYSFRDTVYYGNHKKIDYMKENEQKYQLKTEKTANHVVKIYKSIENGVVNTYKSIENGVVSVYKKIEKKFIDTFLEEKDE